MESAGVRYLRTSCFCIRNLTRSISDREPGKQQRKGIKRTRRKLLLCFLSELPCLSFKLKLILKPAILLNFTHFQLYIENKQLRLLIVLGLPHILTVSFVLTNVFTKMLILRFRCHFAVSVWRQILALLKDLK